MVKRNKFLALVLVLTMAFAITACGPKPVMNGEDGDSFMEMTTKGKATYLLQLYNKQYEEYMNLWMKPNRTEADNKYLKDKKKALEEIYPYIDTFAGYVDTGTVPPAAVEAAALAAINKLLNT